MFSLLLAIIYLAFISLGLPDSLLGAAWPTMVFDLDAPLSCAGVVSLIISGGTIVSSLLSDKLTYRFGTGLVTTTSVACTALALTGFAFADSFMVLCFWAVPYGLGAGAIDAALNNYVALHYASRHMSWLHCFWGVGASVGPYIMGWALSAGQGWRMGYGSVAAIQVALTTIMLFAIPLWKKRDAEEQGKKNAPLKLGNLLKIKGVKPLLIAFFAYCGVETTAGLWASSYLVENRSICPETAANFASMFYLGITVGRFLSGFITDKVGDKNMIRIGTAIMLAGALLVALPAGSVIITLGGIAVMGLGAAPVYPCIIHATPANFGKECSQSIVGMEMAGAYCGNVILPPLFGLIAQHFSISLYPYYCALFIVILGIITEHVNKINKSNIQ